MKQSSYSKLKEQLRQTELMVYTLVNEPESKEAEVIRTTINAKTMIDKSVWQGGFQTGTKIDGFIELMK